MSFTNPKEGDSIFHQGNFWKVKLVKNFDTFTIFYCEYKNQERGFVKSGPYWEEPSIEMKALYL